MFSWYKEKMMPRNEDDIAESQQRPERPVVFRSMSKSLQKAYRESILDQIECLCAKDPELKAAIFERFAKRNPHYDPLKHGPPREMPDKKQGLLSGCLPDLRNKKSKTRLSSPDMNDKEVKNCSNIPVLPPLKTAHQSTPQTPEPPSAPGQSTGPSKRFENVARYFRKKVIIEEEVNTHRACSTVIEEPESPITSPVPPPHKPANPQARRRVLGIPVLCAKTSGYDKEVAGGYRLQTGLVQVDKMHSDWKQIRQGFFTRPPKPPAGQRNKLTSAPAPVTKTPVPTRPSDPISRLETFTQTENFTPSAPPRAAPTKKTRTSRPSKVRMPPPKPVPRAQNSPSPSPEPVPTKKTKKSGPEKITVTRSQRQTEALDNLAKLQPLFNPEDSLNKCLDLIRDGEWDKKISGLQTIQALAQNHQEELKLRLYEVCDAVVDVVKNLRSAVASAAIDTLVYVSLYLKEDMDTQAEKSGQALLLKIAQANGNVFIQKRASKALEVLVQCCTPGAVMNVLVRTGLSHLLPAVKVSAAQQLHLLADELGMPGLLASGKAFTKTFLSAVNRMALDSAAGVREHGLAILKELVGQRGFEKNWKDTVSYKDQPYLDKILAKIERD